MNRGAQASQPLLTEVPTPTRKGGGETVKKPLYGVFSPYNSFLFCGHCGRWVARESAVLNVRGHPCCPYCGRPLRMKPRGKRRWES